MKSLSCHSSTQNPAGTFHFSHRKSPSPPKSPQGPAQSVPSGLSQLRPRLPPLSPSHGSGRSTRPGMPFPQIATRLMPSPSPSLHATVTSVRRPAPSPLLKRAALPPELSILSHIPPGTFGFSCHSTCYLLTFYVICWGS